jgi:hypothetical protein
MEFRVYPEEEIFEQNSESSEKRSPKTVSVSLRFSFVLLYEFFQYPSYLSDLVRDTAKIGNKRFRFGGSNDPCTTTLLWIG